MIISIKNISNPYIYFSIILIMLTNITCNANNIPESIKKIKVEEQIKNLPNVSFTNLENKSNFTYHHIGIYAFTNKALIRYVSLKRSKLEIERKLEQMRALEDKMKIDVGYIKSCPLSVDTEADLKAVKKIMEN